MNRFELARADSVAQARELAAEKAGGVLKAGGIDLLDHLKEHLLEPPRLVGLKRITGLAGIEDSVPVSVGAAVVDRGETDQLLGRLDQRRVLQKGGVHHGEKRRVCADSQRQDQNRHQGESRVPDERAHAVSDVL